MIALRSVCEVHEITKEHLFQLARKKKLIMETVFM